MDKSKINIHFNIFRIFNLLGNVLNNFNTTTTKWHNTQEVEMESVNHYSSLNIAYDLIWWTACVAVMAYIFNRLYPTDKMYLNVP